MHLVNSYKSDWTWKRPSNEVKDHRGEIGTTTDCFTMAFIIQMYLNNTHNPIIGGGTIFDVVS